MFDESKELLIEIINWIKRQVTQYHVLVNGWTEKEIVHSTKTYVEALDWVEQYVDARGATVEIVEHGLLSGRLVDRFHF